MLPKKSLLALDGFNIMYRAFHGNEKLTGPGGHPTGAIHGFLKTVRMLEKILPDHRIVVTLDPFPAGHRAPAGNQRLMELADLGDTGLSRHDLYPGYKGTRSEMPDDMKVQLIPLVLILQGLGYSVLQGNAYAEADDLLASLATLAMSRGEPVVVGSGDKDTFKLVKDGYCRVFSPNTNTMIEEKDVIAKFGVSPEKMEDFLALMGDAVDNIPGVKSCGEKTAAKWLNKYNDLDGIIQNAHLIKGVVGEHLRDAIPMLPTYKALTALRTNLPIDYDAATQNYPVDVPLLAHIYTKLGMRKALSGLSLHHTTGPTP